MAETVAERLAAELIALADHSAFANPATERLIRNSADELQRLTCWLEYARNATTGPAPEPARTPLVATRTISDVPHDGESFLPLQLLPVPPGTEVQVFATGQDQP